MNSMPFNGTGMQPPCLSPSCLAAQASLMNNPNGTSSVQQAIDANGQMGTSGPQQPVPISTLASQAMGPQMGTQMQQQNIPSFAIPETGNNAPVIPASTLVPPGTLPGAAQLFPTVVPEEIPVSFSPTSLQYLNGFLRSQIGRRVTVEFLTGTNNLTERSGILLGVGVNYILLNEIEGDDVIACDFYTIKFIHFYF